jgi:hypothetical protein
MAAAPQNLSPEDAKLASAARAVATTASDAIAWIDENAAKLKEDRARLAREFRRGAARARKLAQAAERPMCVSVFGPSQAGKSYLISALARRGTDPVRAVFGTETRDFLEEINPAGGKESTGLVTRFTIRPQPQLPGLPVAVRLLSVTDVVKIFGNSFMEDFNRDSIAPLPVEKRAELMKRLAGRAAAAPQPGLSEDDVWDLQEYFAARFGGHPIFRELGADFWREAAALAPRLSHADRADLFGLLWNSLPAFTETTKQLFEALGALGHADDAFLPVEALIPREASVIDVATLGGLAGGSNHPPVTVGTASGARATLERPIITALIAELRLQIADKPWDFFDHTDLLDFPGARSREVLSDPESYTADRSKITLLFIRGKVAYLYQRYLAEQEITAMLLCLVSGNQEVRTLPAMVKEWIDETHGRTAADRANLPTSLFLVLTKFDLMFETKKGMEGVSDTARWSVPVETTLNTFLGLEFKWHEEWHPRKPFDNVFWLRNPNLPNKGLMDYDENLREQGVRESERPRIARLRDGFLANEDVARHFSDPTLKWDSAMTLNDGGISLLAKRLAPVSNPALKRGQVAARLGELGTALAARLEPYYHTGDLEAELKKRRDASRNAGLRLLQHTAPAQRFGAMLREFTIPPDHFADLFYRVQLRPPPDDGIAAPIGAAVDGGGLASDFLEGLGDAAPPPPPSNVQPRDMASMFAEAAMDEFADRVQAFAESTEAESWFRLDKPSAATLAAELLLAVRRLDLRGRLGEKIRADLAFVKGVNERLMRPAMLAADALGGFVTHLGFDAVPEDRRPKAGRDQRPIFRARQADDDLPTLGATAEAWDAAFTLDWVTGFVRLTEDNVRGTEADAVDVAANAALGRMLSTLKSAA